MKEFEIDVPENKDIYNSILESFEDDAETLEEIKELYNECVGCKKITTFEEYFQLLEKISNLTEGEYNIYNNGTLILLWE